MKALLMAMITLTTISAHAQITHKTCKLWIPTWQPQGHLYVADAEYEVRKLRLKGYDARFGNTRSGDSNNELFLEANEVITKNSNLLQKGKAKLNFVVRDLNPEAEDKIVHIDETSVSCSFYHPEDPAAYKDYTQDCTSNLVKRMEALPNCVKI